LSEDWDGEKPELDYGVQYPYDCLKHRIEKFITNDEPFPSRELTDDDDDVGFYGVPFAYKQDLSWRFVSTLL
jgi:hypothetical protein